MLHPGALRWLIWCFFDWYAFFLTDIEFWKTISVKVKFDISQNLADWYRIGVDWYKSVGFRDGPHISQKPYQSKFVDWYQKDVWLIWADWYAQKTDWYGLLMWLIWWMGLTDMMNGIDWYVLGNWQISNDRNVKNTSYFFSVNNSSSSPHPS